MRHTFILQLPIPQRPRHRIGLKIQAKVREVHVELLILVVVVADKSVLGVAPDDRFGRAGADR